MHASSLLWRAGSNMGDDSAVALARAAAHHRLVRFGLSCESTMSEWRALFGRC